MTCLARQRCGAANVDGDGASSNVNVQNRKRIYVAENALTRD